VYNVAERGIHSGNRHFNVVGGVRCAEKPSTPMNDPNTAVLQLALERQLELHVSSRKIAVIENRSARECRAKHHPEALRTQLNVVVAPHRLDSSTQVIPAPLNHAIHGAVISCEFIERRNARHDRRRVPVVGTGMVYTAREFIHQIGTTRKRRQWEAAGDRFRKDS
jgi:hypothetical protein